MIWAGISSVAGRAGGRFFFATLVHHRRPLPVPPRTKFGALSIPTGRVDVAWTIDEQRLRLVWTERGGPLVEPPTRRSFGTRMMESLGQQLNGQVQLAYEPSGFVYSLDVPLSSIIAA